jgi:hypothetical protein
MSLEVSICNCVSQFAPPLKKVQAVCLWMSTGIYVQACSKASPKCLPKATDDFRVAITDQHTG